MAGVSNKGNGGKLPQRIFIPVRAFIPLTLPDDITIKELARIGFMLGVEFDFNLRKARKRRKRNKK